MSVNRWLKFTIACNPLLVEPIGDFLVGVLEAGVETGAADEADFGTLSCYLGKANPEPQEVADTIARLSTHLEHLAEVFKVEVPVLTTTFFEEEDWSSTWKEHFKPFVIIPGLVIAPTWEEYRPQPEEAVITMDPGMAFGTGHHATTSLSLELLHRTLNNGSAMHVLDVGTGTGILGMAALLFGAKSCLGLDNDSEAVSAAVENVRRNHLDDRMQVSLQPLGEQTGCYQVVVANIVHDVLLDLAPDLTRLTDAGGYLILSGILAGEQVVSIENHFSARGFTLLDRQTRQEWAALRFCRR
jgi:ribosomal protein L11 methyltransferase